MVNFTPPEKQKTIDTSALRSSPVPVKDGTNVKVERILNTGTKFTSFLKSALLLLLLLTSLSYHAFRFD